MKTAKTVIKIIVIIAAIAVIAVGGYFLKTKGLNFPENGLYTKNNIVEEAKPYAIKLGICLALVLGYLMIRFNKLGVIKVAVISLLAIVGIQALIIAIMAITRFGINRMFFSILLSAFVLTILVITTIYENRLKTI